MFYPLEASREGRFLRHSYKEARRTGNGGTVLRASSPELLPVSNTMESFEHLLRLLPLTTCVIMCE